MQNYKKYAIPPAQLIIADMDRKMEKGEINRYEEIKYPIVENGL